MDACDSVMKGGRWQKHCHRWSTCCHALHCQAASLARSVWLAKQLAEFLGESKGSCHHSSPSPFAPCQTLSTHPPRLVQGLAPTDSNTLYILDYPKVIPFVASIGSMTIMLEEGQPPILLVQSNTNLVAPPLPNICHLPPSRHAVTNSHVMVEMNGNINKY